MSQEVRRILNEALFLSRERLLLDGSWSVVARNDPLNGQHNDVYAYDPTSGRLSSVTDTIPDPDVVHNFTWNPEGTLARLEFRFSCSISCGGIPLRVYFRDMGSQTWQSGEDYMWQGGFVVVQSEPEGVCLGIRALCVPIPSQPS